MDGTKRSQASPTLRGEGVVGGGGGRGGCFPVFCESCGGRISCERVSAPSGVVGRLVV